jgi:hypothetical protein
VRTANPSSPKGGPKTPEGKAVSRHNAVKHGIRSKAPVLPHLENTEEWQGHLQSTLESLAPVGHLECLLAERVAWQLWRLHRVTRYESEMLATQQENLEKELHKERRFRSGQPICCHPADFRDEVGIRQGALDSINRLHEFQDQDPIPAEMAAGVLWRVAGHLEGWDEWPELPFLPSDLTPDYWCEWDGWTAGMVRQCLDLAAKGTGRTREEVLEAARFTAEHELLVAKMDMERSETEVKQARRAAMMLEESAVSTIMRFEGHLTRQLSATLRELEALQERRKAQAPTQGATFPN